MSEFINENVRIDVETGIMDMERAYEYTIEENLHTKDVELSIMVLDGLFGEYLYNTTEEAEQDIEVLCMMGYTINEV